MASSMPILFTVLALCAVNSLGLKVRGKVILNPTIHGSHIDDPHSSDSKPGTPEVAGLTGKPSTWQEELGERLLRAAEASDAMKKCDSFFSFGDYTWCEKAMPAKTAFQAIHGHEYQLRKTTKLAKEAEKSTGQFLGLSYGIFTGDLWSELMSNKYLVETKLHDCTFNEWKEKYNQGPMLFDLHAGFSKENQCKKRGCYSLPYEARNVCVGAEISEQGGRKFEPLSVTLQDRAPLSTFVKMDVEGAEWPVLEQLLSNPEDMAKIRSLDLEIHLNMPNAGDKSVLEHKVEIMERLAKEFAVTGSTIEPLHRALGNHPRKPWEKPPLIYPTNGLSLDQYCISFVNRKLL